MSALRHWGRSLSSLFTGVVAGALVVVVVALLVIPWATGGRSFTVMSGSMQPTIDTGDIVVDRGIRGSEIRVGDIVTFHDPNGGDRLLTHRVRSIAPGPAGSLAITTQGDANNDPEHWTIKRDGRLGRVALRVPQAGRALAYTRTPPGRIVLFGLPLLFLMIWALGAIWRPRPPAETT